MRSLSAPLILVAVLAAGCGGGSSSEAPSEKQLPLATESALVKPLPAGEVKGRLLSRIDSPARTAEAPLRGTVTFTAADGAVARTQVDSGGEFQIQLSPGIYRLRGTSPEVNGGRTECSTQEPTTELLEGETVTVDIICFLR